MKKTLLLLSVAALATMANAEVIVGLASSEELEAAGLSGTKADHEPCTILDNEAGTFGLAYADSWGTTTTYKTYQNITVDGEAITLGSGAVGNTNPVFVSYEAGVMSAGAVFKYTAKKDGYMTVFTKLNPNKQYLVFEGTVSGLPFTLGYFNGTENIFYTMPSDADGLLDTTAPDADKYFVAATKQVTNADGVKAWVNKNNPDDIVYADSKPSDDYQALNEVIPGATKPAMPWNVAGLEKAPGESTGFLTFEVIEGNDYYFSALGSKAACGGFVYTSELPVIKYEATSTTDKDTGAVTEYPEYVFDLAASVETLGSAVAADENAPIYNMMGVRVNADAKGILIQNGKKFIRK